MVDNESSAETSENRTEFPPLVYVPTTSEDDPATRRILMHKVEDGRTALYTYSAIDRLHRYYLPKAPWVVCDVPALQRVHDETPYDLLFLDVDPGLRDWEKDGVS
ncbi:SAV_915 family protein [Nocardioides sp. WG-D5]